MEWEHFLDHILKKLLNDKGKNVYIFNVDFCKL